MRHYSCRFFSTFFAVVLVTSSFAHPQQPWSNIVNSSRAIDWSHAGLPATLPDGETTPNPWTPPTRPACTSTQAGITVPVAAGTSFSSIVTAMHNCSVANATGSYLLLGSGSFTISSTSYLNTAPYVTLRGSGPMSTTLNFSGSGTTLQFGLGGSMGGGTLSTSPGAGTASVTLTGVSGSVPVVGAFAWFNQCDTGLSGSAQPTTGYDACTGTRADNGGLFVCGATTICNSNGTASGGGGQSQFQYVKITSVTNNGGGSYTIGFGPGLYLPNWSTASTAAMYWQTSNVANGVGLEDMTISFASGSGELSIGNAYASWTKGVRFVGPGHNDQVSIAYTKNSLFANNYMFGAAPATMASPSIIIAERFSSDNLILNNMQEFGILVEEQGSTAGNVVAYNYAKSNGADYITGVNYTHNNWSSGIAFLLNEGNQFNGIIDDDTWGAGALDTFFRNWVSCSNEPYVYGAGSGVGIGIDAFHRFDNAVGNVLAGGNNCSTYSGSANQDWFRINYQGTDALAGTSLLRWYNYDAATGTTRCQSSEVPSSLSGPAAPFSNSVPGSCSAPASFYMNSMGFHPSGGTGLSWWKVCSSGFNASTGACSGSTTTLPFPSSGPDVTSGTYANGYSYGNPAGLAWKTLPIDTSLQNHYTITGSSWSGGTETLTVSGLPSGHNAIMGPFQISGVACATSGAGTATGAEVTMTGSTTGTISYALASNPGTCTGTMLWPDVRQFDQRVYQDDSSENGQSAPEPPTGLTSTAQ